MNMMNIPLDLFALKNVSINEDGDYVFKASGGELSIECDNGKLADLHQLKTSDYIVMDVTCKSGSSCTVVWDFLDGETAKETGTGYGSGVKQGILPSVRTRLALPYEVCEGKQLFLPRTPGKLKTVVHGRPIKPDALKCFKIRSDAAPCDVILQIHNVFICDEQPDFPVESLDLVDDLGQKNIGAWKGRTKSVVEMAANLRAEITKKDTSPVAERSMFGGWTGKRFDEGTGFFRLINSEDRYWLADPEGYAFFSMGLDCINIDGDCNLNGIECLCKNLPDRETVGWSTGWHGSHVFSWHKYNLYRAFGDGYEQDWMDITKNRMNSWGFNTVACWSELDFARYAKIPYTYIFRGYPKTQTNIFRDFPDVFSDEFADNCKKWAKQIEDFKDDPYLIGYFMSNEPNWAFVNGLNIARMTLECKEELESRNVLATFMENIYFTIENLNAAWGSSYETFDDMRKPHDTSGFNENAEGALMAFSAEMIREYIKAPALAIKEIDKNHLNLGIRYAWLSSKALAAGSEYTDIFSFNCYNMDPYDSIETISSLVNKPVMIGEFYFGALDRGLDATGIRGVTTQSERAQAYKFYMHRAASHPMCLGAHYFQLNDQGYLGRFDGENYQIGLVDVCNKPYDEFVDGIRETNEELYKVVSGETQPTQRRAHEINPIFF